MEQSYQVPPCPSDPAEAVRWTATRRRRRLMSGCWDQDLEARLLLHFGGLRRSILGPRAMSKNPYRRVAWQLASLYTLPPTPTHSAPGERTATVQAFLDRDGLLDKSGRWHLAPRLQAFTLGLRQMFTRVDLDRPHGVLTHRLVYPDVVTGVRVHPADPVRPVAIMELRWRESICKWCWDLLSVENPDRPVYEVREAFLGGTIGRDITAEVLGGAFSGSRYPYRWTEGPRRGRPFVPYVRWTAQWSGEIWTHEEWREFAEATLDLASAWTWWGHALFKASWPQRWGLDVHVAGAAPEDTEAGARSDVPTDPTSLLHLESEARSQNPQVGQWGPATDILSMQQAISSWEASLADVEGIDAAHIVRQSADAWSGAALAISRDGKREAQEVYREPFRRSDLAELEISAALINLAQLLPQQLPESGYRQHYAPIPLSPQELAGRRQHNNEMIDRGRMSSVDAYMSEHPGMSRQDALVDLKRIAEEEAALEKMRLNFKPKITPLGGDPATP